MALTFIFGIAVGISGDMRRGEIDDGPDFSTKNRGRCASKSREGGAGHAEKAGRKPRMIGDIEVDEPVHGS